MTLDPGAHVLDVQFLRDQRQPVLDEAGMAHLVGPEPLQRSMVVATNGDPIALLASADTLVVWMPVEIADAAEFDRVVDTSKPRSRNTCLAPRRRAHDA